MPKIIERPSDASARIELKTKPPTVSWTACSYHGSSPIFGPIGNWNAMSFSIEISRVFSTCLGFVSCVPDGRVDSSILTTIVVPRTSMLLPGRRIANDPSSPDTASPSGLPCGSSTVILTPETGCGGVLPVSQSRPTT